ncbi:hypothetical protein J7K50_01070 [bacterium]|nr:hypothetical protein [bacterium]
MTIEEVDKPVSDDDWLAVKHQLEKMGRFWVVQIVLHLLRLMIQKGGDYGDRNDSLSNLTPDGWPGVLVRMRDKTFRVFNAFDRFKRSGKINFEVVEETICETLGDLANYAIIVIHLMLQGVRGGWFEPDEE